MKKYNDYKIPDNRVRLKPSGGERDRDLTREEISNIKWTKFAIIVPTQEDKDELLEAFEKIHYSDVDLDYVTINQLAHQYLEDEGCYIKVDEELYNLINKK